MTREERAAKRRAQVARYNQSEKGRARARRYNSTAKGRDRTTRYLSSENGRAKAARINTRCNPRRLYVGTRYVGSVPSMEQAAVINAHIKDKLHGFIAGQQARTQAESVSSGTVPPQAEP